MYRRLPENPLLKQALDENVIPTQAKAMHPWSEVPLQIRAV